MSANGFSAGHYKPGDKNYPKVNPSPTHYIEISARTDAKLPVVFDTVFTTFSDSCMHQPAGSALEGAGGFAYAINFPIEMKPVGDHSEGRFATDAMLPGSCDWRFTGIIARAHDEDAFHGKLVIQGQWVVEVGSAADASKSPNLSLKATCELTGPRFGKVGVELLCFDASPWAWISPQTNSLQIEIVGSSNPGK